MPRRATLKAYFEELLATEKLQPLELVADWPSTLVKDIQTVFHDAYEASALVGSTLALKPGSKPQSAGNQIEKFAAERLAAHCGQWTLDQCTGPGYPDRLIRNTVHKIAVEFKSTGQWNDKDSLRCVLASSSRKLRSQFTAPIHHLLITVKFSRVIDLVTIKGMRLDFLMTTTSVNVILEGSVNQRLLAEATHPKHEF